MIYKNGKNITNIYYKNKETKKIFYKNKLVWEKTAPTGLHLIVPVLPGLDYLLYRDGDYGMPSGLFPPKDISDFSTSLYSSYVFLMIQPKAGTSVSNFILLINGVDMLNQTATLYKNKTTGKYDRAIIEVKLR